MNTIGRARVFPTQVTCRRLVLPLLLIVVLLLFPSAPLRSDEQQWAVFFAAGSSYTASGLSGQGGEARAQCSTQNGVVDDPAVDDPFDGSIPPPVVAPVAMTGWYRPDWQGSAEGIYLRDVRRPLAESGAAGKTWDDLIVWGTNALGQYTSDKIVMLVSASGVPNSSQGILVRYSLEMAQAPAGYAGPTTFALPLFPDPGGTAKTAWFQLELPSAGAVISDPIEGSGPLAATQVAGYRFRFKATPTVSGPTTTINSGPLPGSVKNSRTVTFTFEGFGVLEPLGYLQYQVQLDGLGWSAPATSKSITFNGLSDGPHTFSVRVIDGTGAVDPNPPSVTWTVDGTAPTIEITSGPGREEYILVNSTTFTFGALDDRTPAERLRFDFALDGSPWQPVSGALGVTLQGLLKGAHIFSVRVGDEAGNTVSVSRTFYVDLADPSVSITGGPTNGTVTRPAGQFMFTGTDDVTPVAQMRYQTKLDGEGWSGAGTVTSYQFDALAFGQHTFSVRAVDLAGRVSPSRIVIWTVAAEAQVETTITGGPEDGLHTNSTSATFSFSGIGALPLQFQTKLDTGAWSTSSPATAATYAGLATGQHTFSVRAVDATGAVDSSPDARTWWVDTQPPIVTITGGPANGSWLKAESVTLQFTGTDDLTPAGSLEFETRVDSGPWTAAGGSGEHTYGGLAEGQRQLWIRAKDEASNYSTATGRSVYVDRTPPVTTLEPFPSYSRPSGTIRFSGSDNLTPQLGLVFQTKLDEAEWSGWYNYTPFSFTNLAEGPHTLQVRARDFAGNEEPSPKTLAFQVDATPPSTVITGGPGEGSHIAVRYTTFSFTSTDNMSSPAHTFYDWRSDGGAWVRIPVAGAAGYLFTNLAERSHTFSVRAVDAAGNIDPNPPVRTWTVDVTPPSTAISGGPAEGSFDGTGTGAFAFTGTDNLTPAASLRFRTRVDGGAWSVPGSDATFSFAGLAPGAHTFSVVAVDLAGNEDASPAVRHWTVDLAPPAGLTVTDNGATTTDITKLHASWSVSAGPSGVAEYQFAIGTDPVDPGAGYLVPWASAGTATEVTRAALPLKIGTTYYFYVRARSGAGLWSDVAASDGILVESPPFETVGQTKRLPNSLTGTLRGVIVVAGPSSFYEGIYVEAQDRSAGLKVVTTEAVQEGDIVDVTGKLITSLTGEKAIQATEVKITGQTVPLLPLSMKLLSAAGRSADFNASTGAGQRGVTDPPGWGTNCSGMLVKVCGWVGEVDFATATIRVNDGSWPDLLGARVDGVTALSGVHLNSLVTVTGVVGMRRAGLSYQLVIHTRKAEDLQIDLLDPPLEMIRRLQWLGL